MNDLKQELKELIIKYPNNYGQMLNTKLFSRLKTKIIEATSFLSDDYDLQTRIFYVLEDLSDYPKCEICGRKILDKASKKLGFGTTHHDGSFAYICHDKKCRNEHRLNEMKFTLLEKYGVDSPIKSSIIREKMRKTNLEKYGVEFYTQTNEYHDKVKAISREKYDANHWLSSNEIKEKRKKTNISKYGTENVFQSSIVKEKIKKTNLEKYGVENVSQSLKIRKKIQDTNLEKYGSDSPFKSDEIREKIKNTLIERYGVDSPGKTINSRMATSLRNSQIMYFRLFDSKYDIPLFSFESFRKHNKMLPLKFQCKQCGYIFESTHYDGYHRKCPICFPVIKEQSYSNKEKSIVAYLKEIYRGNVIENYRSILNGKEIDIYIPDKRLAIEFDGLYWHSDNVLNDKNYHLKKTEECEKQEIQLIHIFENEWDFKQDIVKSRLKNLLGIYDNKCYARQCEIREISSKESFDFQEANHIQGAINSKISLGLYFKEDLVSLMTFSKPRFNKKYEWELLRFCNKLGWHIPGAASKLLKFFEEKYQPKNIVSYADRRWSRGNLYKQLGFELDHVSSPNYWYWKNHGIQLESRVKYQKHKLQKLLEKFDPSKTEVENMKDNGFNRIFDCGNLVFVKKIAII